MERDQLDDITGHYMMGEVGPDALFEPQYWDETPAEHYPAMTEWDAFHHKRLEALVPDEAFHTREQELELAKRIQTGNSAATDLKTGRQMWAKTRTRLEQERDEGLSAQEELVVNNLRLAAWFVRHTMDFGKKQRERAGKSGKRGRFIGDLSSLAGGDLDYSDRFQVASIALWNAASKYTGYTKRGNQVRFSNWALWEVEKDVSRVIFERQSPVSYGPSAAKEISQLRKVRRKYEDEGVLRPSVEQLAGKLGLSHHSQVFELMDAEAASQHVSYEVFVDYVNTRLAEEVMVYEVDEQDEALILADTLVHAGTELSTAEMAMEWQVGKDVDDLVVLLDAREELVIGLRYGLEDGIRHTLREVGEHFGVTAERIRKIEVKALAKLRGFAYRTEAAVDEDLISQKESHAGNLRPIVSMSEGDDAALGLMRPEPYSSAYDADKNPVEEQFAPRRRTYTLPELHELRRAREALQ